MEVQEPQVMITAAIGGYIVDYELPAIPKKGEDFTPPNETGSAVFQNINGALKFAKEILDKWTKPVKVSDITGKPKKAPPKPP